MSLFDAHHDGHTYVASIDKTRLNAQTERVFQVMRDGAWRTLDEIAGITGDPPASVSARLRDLRKEKFGGFAVGRRRRTKGLFEYRLILEAP